MTSSTHPIKVESYVLGQVIGYVPTDVPTNPEDINWAGNLPKYYPFGNS